MISCNNKIDNLSFIYNSNLINSGIVAVIFGFFFSAFLLEGNYDKE